MWTEGKHCKKLVSVNDELLKLKGELKTEEAQITFAKFLASNPTFAAKLLMGVELYPFQQMKIKTMFQRDFCLDIASRGFAKSWTIAIFIVLYAIFNPGCKIGIVSKTFRQARAIFKQIEDFIKSPKGIFLAQCVTEKANHGADSWTIGIGKSKITALPLGDGQRLRGYRFNVIVIDEALLLSEQIINEVLRPFLAVNLDPIMRQKVKEAVDVLIANGELKEEDRIKFEFTGQKLICLSSASYKFEYLYKLYCDYKEKITTDFEKLKNVESVSHAILQMSHKIAPAGLLSNQQINEAKATMSTAQFGREFEAQFSDDSAGYFSQQKMNLATIEDGQFPCTKIYGDKGKKYILSIDPNYSDSETSDHFGMSIGELNEEDRTATLVHVYAVSKSNTKARAVYMKYIFDNFNIVYVILDNAGGARFIEDVCNLPEFKDAGLKLSFFEADFENEDYAEGLDNSKRSYNLTEKKICHAQSFQSKWIRMANEHLQGCIEHKRIRFASTPDEANFDAQMKSNIDVADLEFDLDTAGVNEGKKAEFIERQKYLIELTKVECSLIQITTSPDGRQTFDLPRNLKQDKSPERARKDSYTTLLLLNWAVKCYFDMEGFKKERINGFVPFGMS